MREFAGAAQQLTAVVNCDWGHHQLCAAAVGVPERPQIGVLMVRGAGA